MMIQIHSPSPGWRMLREWPRKSCVWRDRGLELTYVMQDTCVHLSCQQRNLIDPNDLGARSDRKGIRSGTILDGTQ